MSDLLEIRGLSCGYGYCPMRDGVVLIVREGEAVLLAGPNRRGKSHFLKTIIGALPLIGDVMFNGVSLVGQFVEERVRAHIGFRRQMNNYLPVQGV